jgi:deoxyribonuclease V
MELVRPDLAPDPALDREEMEALQREIAAAAMFEDDHGIAPASITVSESIPLDTVRQSGLAEYETAGSGEGDAAENTTTEAGGSASAPEKRDDPIVVGVDQSFLDEQAISAIVAIQDGAVIERAHAVSPLSIPYIPGLLAFREGGPILDAFEALSVEPDLAMFDGSGRIHFREAGIATHMGVVLDLPSVGVAKRLLCGTPANDTGGRAAGWRTAIRADDRVEASPETVLGYAYQSRQWTDSRSINPLYVSPGHRVSADTTVAVVKALCSGYKLPEPTRLADTYAEELKSAHE